MSTYAARFTVHFTPKEALEVPGFTVKFLKSLVITHDSGGAIKSLLLSREANKPVQLSPVMLGSKALLSTSPIKLVPSSRYWFRLGLVGTEELINSASDLVTKLTEHLTDVVSIEVESEPLETLTEAPSTFTVKLLTPAVIKAKDSTLIKYPTLKELIASPIKVLGRVLWERYAINIPTTWAWRISSYYVITRAETRTARVDIGGGRVVEGVLGTWAFRKVAKPPKYLEAVLAKTLAVAHAVGTGKSRAIGFGLTEVIK